MRDYNINTRRELEEDAKNFMSPEYRVLFAGIPHVSFHMTKIKMWIDSIDPKYYPACIIRVRSR